MDRDVLLSMCPMKSSARRRRSGDSAAPPLDPAGSTSVPLIAAGLAALLTVGCGSFGAGDPFAGTGGSSAESSSSGQDGGTPLPPPLRAKSIAVGRAHSCAVLDDGTVACWGAGDHGQLGDRGSGADHASAV